MNRVSAERRLRFAGIDGAFSGASSAASLPILQGRGLQVFLCDVKNPRQWRFESEMKTYE
jgi:hypothetical protein